MSKKEKPQEQTVPCCPELETSPVCDVLEYQYRLNHPVIVGTGRTNRNVQVEVILNARLERCPGPLSLGELAYSTTLLPGEKVHLFITDRRTRFTYDSTSKLSYRTEQTQEEQYYMSSMDEFMSDLTVRDSGSSTNTTKGHSDTHGETSGVLETLFGSPSVNVKGDFNGESTSDFGRELSQHAKASHHRSENATRTASAVSVGEVQTRTHAEGETQDHFEAASREFSNPNKCHAITFYFYRINKTQTVKFSIVSIERRVIDPAVDTKVTNNPFTSKGAISTVPTSVLATDPKRLELEEIGRRSSAAQTSTTATSTQVNRAVGTFSAVALNPQPLPPAVRKQALSLVDSQLVNAGLLDAETGQISPKTKSFSFEMRSSLPTPGLLVKGCLDTCDVCDEGRKHEISLELEHKRLENELLKRQIELLDKAQEYRCCPPNTTQPVSSPP